MRKFSPFLIILLIIFSCENSEKDNTRNLVLDNFDLYSEYQAAKYFITDVKTVDDNFQNEYNENTLFNKIRNLPKSLLLIENSIKSLKSEITIPDANVQFLVILSDNQILDIIEVNKSDKNIALKDIVQIADGDVLESNKINIISRDNMVLNSANLSNASIVIFSNLIFNINNAVFDNCILNFNFTGDDFLFSNSSFNNSYLINLSKSIELFATNSFDNTIIRDKVGENAAFLVSNSNNSFNETVITDIPLVFSGNTNTITMTNSLVMNTNELMSLEADNDVSVSNSIFQNNTNVFSLADGTLSVNNSVFKNNNLVFTTTQEALDIENNVFLSDFNAQLIRLRYNFYLKDKRDMIFNNNNIIMTHPDYVIFMDAGVQGTNKIEINSSFLDFNVSDVYDRILDKNHNRNLNIAGEVTITNMLNEKITTIGIQN